MTQRSVAESLLQVGVTQRFIDDVVSAVLRASYGQSASMPAFAGECEALSLLVLPAHIFRTSWVPMKTWLITMALILFFLTFLFFFMFLILKAHYI